MARVITTTNCIGTMLSRITTLNCPASVRRTPSGFVQNYMPKWDHLLIQAGGFPGALTEERLEHQYIEIRKLIDRLGYMHHPESDPKTRFAQITRAVESILSRDTKSGFMWQQIFERNPTYLDAMVMMQLWILLVDDARAARDSISESDRLTRANQREITRLTTTRESIQARIKDTEAKMTVLRSQLDSLIQSELEILNQLHALSGGDSDPSPTARADSGTDHRPPAAPAGDSDRISSEFRD